MIFVLLSTPEQSIVSMGQFLARYGAIEFAKFPTKFTTKVTGWVAAG